MVLAGQYLERSVVVKSGDLVLDALSHRGPRMPRCVLASPHPALGGSMTAPVIAELAWALTRAGHATLRFDYRGVGASQGRSRHAAGSLAGGSRLSPRDLSDEVEDLFAAADQVRLGQTLCAVGYSFGAAVVLAAANDPRIEKVILVAPPTSIADFSRLASVSKPLLVICAHHDALTDRAALQAWLPEGAALEVVPHSDHSFRRGLTDLGRICAAWLRGDRAAEVAAAAQGAPDAAEGIESVREVELDPGDDAPLELDTE